MKLITIAAAVLAGLGVVAWWSVLIPSGLLVAFFAVARVSVVAMHRSLDARSAAVKAGFDEDEDTVAIRELEREVAAHEGLVPVLLPVGDGLLLAKKEWAPEPHAG